MITDCKTGVETRAGVFDPEQTKQLLGRVQELEFKLRSEQQKLAEHAVLWFIQPVTYTCYQHSRQELDHAQAHVTRLTAELGDCRRELQSTRQDALVSCLCEEH